MGRSWFSPLEVWGHSFSSVHIKVVQQSVKKKRKTQRSKPDVTNPFTFWVIHNGSQLRLSWHTGTQALHLPFKPPCLVPKTPGARHLSGTRRHWQMTLTIAMKEGQSLMLQMGPKCYRCFKTYSRLKNTGWGSLFHIATLEGKLYQSQALWNHRTGIKKKDSDVII